LKTILFKKGLFSERCRVNYGACLAWCTTFSANFTCCHTRDGWQFCFQQNSATQFNWCCRAVFKGVYGFNPPPPKIMTKKLIFPSVSLFTKTPTTNDEDQFMQTFDN